jgi:hypothetical protein
MKWLKLLWVSRPFFRWSRLAPGDTVVLKGQSYTMTVTFASRQSVGLKSDAMPGEWVHTTVSMILPRWSFLRSVEMVNGRRVVSWL